MDDIAEDVDIQAELAKFSEAEAPAPEAPAEEPKVEAPKAEPQERTVPLAALLEERNKWKSEVEELKTTVSKGNERLEKLFQAINQEQPKAPPQYDNDPLGHLKYGAETAMSEVESLKKWKGDFETQQKQQAEFGKFVSVVQQEEKKFAVQHKDYWEAAEFVKQAQKEEFELLGVPEDQIDQALSQKLIGLTAAAMRSGKSPAEVTYKLAQKYGFKGAAKSGPSLETLAKGQEAAKTVPSGKEDLPVSLEALAQMSDEDFDRAWDKVVKGK